jgi:hypothetical protein
VPNKGDVIVNFQTLARYAFGLVSAFLLASCGGGGAETRVIDVGPLAINPPSATWYAGVKNTFTITGGSAPFVITTSEPGIFAVPQSTFSRTIDVVPQQPGVIDAGLKPEDLQVRTVNVLVRSAEGNTATAVIKVAQNFLTGYGMFVGGTTCQVANTLCAGGETVLFFDTTFNGALFEGHQFRIERVTGPFQFLDPLNTNNQVDAVTVTADHEGKFTTRIRVAAGIPSQVALIKVTDIPTGAYTYRVIPISGTPATGALSIVPSAINLTGPNGTTCGNGAVDVLVFDGQAPYTATCPNPQILVTNPTSGAQPGRFTFIVGANTTCLTNEQCVITDNTGARVIVPVTTIKGTDPATVPLQVAPSAITLACGGTGAVTVIGGSGSYSVNSSHQRVTAVASGNTVSITRAATDPAPVPAGGYPTAATVSITDGASLASVDVTVPATCP